MQYFVVSNEDAINKMWTDSTSSSSKSSPLPMKRKYSVKTRPNSYVAAINNSVLSLNTVELFSSPCLCLPREIWLTILVNYGLTAKDLANLEISCKWFSQCWGGYSITEEAARLVIKRYKRLRFGELTNRLKVISWKERLYILNKLESNACTLAAGSYQNIMVTDDRHVLTWGAGKFGQLGNNVREDYVVPQDVSKCLPSDRQVVQVSAGCGHTGILTNKGEVYICGDNRYGQLGLTNLQSQQCLVPTRVDEGLSSIHIIQIACGSSHTMFLSDTGRVYSVGHGDSGQLGLGPSVKVASTPTCLPLQYEEFNFIFIAAGIAHNNCGKAFTWGLGSAGQLGHGGTKNLSTPAQVTAKVHGKKIIFATASVCHSVLLDSQGEVYTCGKGGGILGHGDTTIKTIPRRVEGLVGIPIVQAAAGVGRTVFIAKDGRGFWCREGMGNHRNIITAVPTAMNLPEPLVAAAIGDSHIVLKMKSGRYMSMGKNGRYQTGHRTLMDGLVPEYTYIPNI